MVRKRPILFRLRKVMNFGPLQLLAHSERLWKMISCFHSHEKAGSYQSSHITLAFWIIILLQICDHYARVRWWCPGEAELTSHANCGAVTPPSRGSFDQLSPDFFATQQQPSHRYQQHPTPQSALSAFSNPWTTKKTAVYFKTTPGKPQT